MKPLQVIFFLFISIFLLNQSPIVAQKQITVEDIWKNYKFSTKSVPGFNFMEDGRHYTRLESNTIKMYDLITGSYVSDILDAETIKDINGFSGKIHGYQFSQDETRILIKSESESIYRRSSIAKYHVYHLESKKLFEIFSDGKIMNASFSPDASKVAYVWNNNLYYFDIEKDETITITTDGKKNQIINGATDWVYEEEFSFTKAFNWSPDGQKIAFIRFDEREVPEFIITQHHDKLYPEYIKFKYPKVGEKNSKVSVHLYNLSNNKLIDANLGDMTDMYIPRLKWTTDANKLCAYKMNRHQNELELLLVDGITGMSTTLLKESNKYYIDITDNLRFLKNGSQFIWTSEKSGFNHIYLYDMSGNEIRALTSGNYDVTNFYGLDEKNKRIFYQASEKSPLVKHVYSVNLRGHSKRNMTPFAGNNSAQFSGTFDYFVNNHSDLNSPPSYIVYDRNGKKVREIEDNLSVVALQKEYDVQDLSFFSFKTSEDVSLNGWILKPPGFREDRQYPVFMTQYSGPGSQSVTDAWKGMNYWWYQMLAQEGFIVACVDGRGTGGRGEEFKKMTYLQLGHYETIDQIEAAKYLGNLPYADAGRIGIFGWSYGGYMSSLCILKGNDVFKAAIAVAPVTSWKWYDTIYTERYMRTLAENEDGYRDNSPIYFADRLKGDYLIVHGDGDDNVHFQNTVEMTRALIAANKQFDTYFYPNRSHSIYGNNARQHLYDKMSSFLREKLLKIDPSMP